MKPFIHHTAHVEPLARIGDDTHIWHFAHVRENARIGERCNIGKDVYIDTEVEIGNGVKIQNGVSVYRGVVVADDVFIGPNAVFTNDLFPRAFNGFALTPTYLDKGCSIGANATIVCGISLGRYCMIGAGAVVTADTLPYGLYRGNPARLAGFVSKDGLPMKMTRKSSNELFLQPSVGKAVRVTFEELP